MQAKIIPVSEKQMKYAKSVADKLLQANIRVEIDENNDTLGYKIRKAQMEKVPYMLIIGDKEVQANQVSVRRRKVGDQGSIDIDSFISNIMCEIKNRNVD